MSTTFGQKLRLNVAAIISEATVGRLLVCIDEEALIEDLASKVRQALARTDVEGHLLRLTNRIGANLPSDERVGDVLRDAEEVIAVLTATPEDPAVRQQLAGGIGEIMSFARAPAQPPIAANVGGGVPRFQQMPQGGPCEQMEDSWQTQLSPSPMAPQPQAPGGQYKQLPGPAETFEEDIADLQIMRGDEQRRLPPGSDWSVEGLSSKLREYISSRFREAHVSACDPGNSFIAVTMRPRPRAGAVPAQPIHYSIARIDIMEFERLCSNKIQETRNRGDYFKRCQQALRAMLEKGVSPTQYAQNMLPYRYRTGEEFTDLISEADTPTFGQVEGFRPTIVIDNSGAVGETLTFVRTALKRLLYSYLVAKSKFNLVKFSPQGNPVAWANGMVPPTAQVLREAEEWLDGIRPVKHNHSANLLEGIQLAMAHPEADAVYVLTSRLPRRMNLDGAVRSLRSMNIRDLPLHVLGIECEPKAELELRRLAEDNHGSFRAKRFLQGRGGDSFGSTLSSSCGLDVTNSVGPRDDDDSHLTISGQLSILEIMLEEQEIATVDWLEEQKCANRLLLTTAFQQPVPDAEQARTMYQRAALSEFKRRNGNSDAHLQELVEAHIGRGPGCAKAAPSEFALPPPVGSAGYGGPGKERQRVAARASDRAASQPRESTPNSCRRPSMANPWDRPGATIKVSQLSRKGPGPLPPRAGRPPSARGSRPASAARADSARRRDW